MKMKKIILPLVALLAMAVSCSSDDDSTDDNTGGGEVEGVLRILSVDAENDLVTLTNLGEGTIDIGDYFLCLGPGTYRQISGQTTEDTNLELNETITVSYDVNPDADGLSIFSTNTFESSDPEILVDFVQWGAGDQPRVDQAVTAGRWDNANNFVEGVNIFTYNGGVADVGSTFWTGEEEAQEEGILRILSVDAVNDMVTLTNLGEGSIDIGDYFLCLGPGTYRQISGQTTEDTNLEPNETITVPYNVNPMEDGLSIFSTNSFTSSDPEILVDYVQWGAANQARSGQAVAAGRWDDVNNFVPENTEYEFIGGTEDIGVTFWE